MHTHGITQYLGSIQPRRGFAEMRKALDREPENLASSPVSMRAQANLFASWASKENVWMC